MAITGAYIVPHPPLIIPAIGKGQEKKISATASAYRQCAKQIAHLRPDLIIVISPHSVMYQDYFHISPGKSAHGDFSDYFAGEVQMDVTYDTDFVFALELAASKGGLPAGTYGERLPSLDHGTMIPLYFVNQYYQDYQVVRIGLSGLSAQEHYCLGMCIKDTVNRMGRNSVLIASGDLSHKLRRDSPYGFSREGAEFDKRVTKAMKKGDFLSFLDFDGDFLGRASECGLKSFQIMAGALDRTDVESHLLSYEGPFGVGYGVASFKPLFENPKRDFLEQYRLKETARIKEKQERESEPVRLARYVLEYYIKRGKPPSLPENLPEDFYTERAGVFVSIKKAGNLRGCVGTITPSAVNLAEEIRKNTISAGSRDPRFDPIQEEELKHLEYSVDILSEPEFIEDSDELDVKRYGVIVTGNGKRGLLLPDLAGVDTVEEQLRIAKQKAGIREWEPVKLERFEVARYE